MSRKFLKGVGKIKIHEYQAKELLHDFGVEIPRGRVASTPEEARDVCVELGGTSVVKAQVYAGGRGQSGGIILAESPDESQRIARTMIGSRLVTKQTSVDGVPVSKVLVEEPADIVQELYVAITIDRASGGPVIIASSFGGVDIEELSAQEPEKIFQESIDISVGFNLFQGRRLARLMGLKNELVVPFAKNLEAIYSLFQRHDASLVEINPLIVTSDNKLVALDAKLTFDDDALFRHPDILNLADHDQDDPLESEAAGYNISYVKLDGNVGCLVNGAGLAMATMDLVKAAGANPSNFLDVGGSASEEKVSQALNIMLKDKNVEGILVNIFGGILRCDVVAKGIVSAYKSNITDIPLVVRMLGTNADEGKAVLSDAGLNVIFAESLSDVIERLRESLR